MNPFGPYTISFHFRSTSANITFEYMNPFGLYTISVHFRFTSTKIYFHIYQPVRFVSCFFLLLTYFNCYVLPNTLFYSDPILFPFISDLLPLTSTSKYMNPFGSYTISFYFRSTSANITSEYMNPFGLYTISVHFRFTSTKIYFHIYQPVRFVSCFFLLLT